MLPSLHSHKKMPDWEYVPEIERTKVQQLAADTHGIITPGNIITLIGLAVVSLGLAKVTQEHYVAGLVLIIVGRLADILDGYIADKTRTKSEIGALVDVVVDKIEVLLALLVLAFFMHVQLYVVVTIVIINGINAFCTAYARRHKIDLHTSRAGKYAMTLCWILITLLVFGVWQPGYIQDFIAYNVFFGYTAVGIWASYHYLRQLFPRK